MLQIDLKNAYNSVSRAHMLECVRAKAPAFAAWADWTYGQPAPLVINEKVTILSQEGVQQGDPLGPLFFALAALPIAQKLCQIPNLLWSGWYLDDGNLAGSLQAFQSCIELLRREGPNLGLFLNASKSTITGLNLSRELLALHGLADLALVMEGTQPAAVVLGHPAGPRPLSTE